MIAPSTSEAARSHVVVERVVAEDGEIRALITGIPSVAMITRGLRDRAAAVIGRVEDHGLIEAEERPLVLSSQNAASRAARPSRMSTPSTIAALVIAMPSVPGIEDRWRPACAHSSADASNASIASSKRPSCTKAWTTFEIGGRRG